MPCFLANSIASLSVNFFKSIFNFSDKASTIFNLANGYLNLISYPLNLVSEMFNFFVKNFNKFSVLSIIPHKSEYAS